MQLLSRQASPTTTLKWAPSRGSKSTLHLSSKQKPDDDKSGRFLPTISKKKSDNDDGKGALTDLYVDQLLSRAEERGPLRSEDDAPFFIRVCTNHGFESCYIADIKIRGQWDHRCVT